MENNKYWNITIKEDNSDVADLYLYNVIDDFAYEGYTDSAESILKDLNDLGNIKTLNVYINSPGGSVFEGISIKNMLDRQKQKGCFINVVIDGLAASIASIIAMAGDKITMPSNALMMIHRASCGCWGNSDDMKKQIEVLDKIDLVLTNTYVTRSGGLLTEEAVKDMFDSGDTWLTAEEAKSYGLCDEITKSLEVAACAEVTKYENKFDPKWSDKVDEWVAGIDLVNEEKEETAVDNSQSNNSQPNIVINLDTKCVTDMLAALQEQINDLMANLAGAKAKDSVEFVEDGVIVNGAKYEVPKNEAEEPVTGEEPTDSTEPTDGAEATENVGDAQDGEVADSEEGNIDDKCKKKDKSEGHIEDFIDPFAFEDYLNNM